MTHLGTCFLPVISMYILDGYSFRCRLRLPRPRVRKNNSLQFYFVTVSQSGQQCVQFLLAGCWALEKLNRANDKEITDRTIIQEALTKELSDTQQQLDNLTKMRYRDLINDEEFKKERKTLQPRVARLQEERDQNEDRARNWLKLSEQTFKFACYARRSFLFGDVRTKREIFAALGQNATLTDGTLSVTPHKWFQPIIENYAELETEYEKVRTESFASIKEQTAAFATVNNSWGE